MGLYDFIIAHFSYQLLFIWSIFEGEIGLAIAGYLSERSHLYLPYVIAIAIVGAVIGDTVLYLTGRLSRHKTERWLKRYETRLKRLEHWFKRYGGWVIVFERFIYGTHIPSLLMIGMSGFGFWRFFLLDLLGVAVWALTFTWLGYAFGQTVVDLLAVVQRHLSAVMIAGLFFFVVYQLYRSGNEPESREP